MTSMNDASWTPQDELEWLAFQYVSAEMTADGAALFEEQLADDQQAREAVARCVEMTHAVVAVAEGDRTVRPAAADIGRRRIYTWAASFVLTLSIVAAFLVGAWMNGEKPDGTSFANRDRKKESTVLKDSDSSSAATLVLAWVSSTEADAADADDDPIGGFPRFEEAASAGPTFAETETVVEGKFDWVLAALDDGPAVPGATDGRDEEGPN